MGAIPRPNLQDDGEHVASPEIADLMRAHGEAAEQKLRGMSYRHDPFGFKRMKLSELRWWRASYEGHRAGALHRDRCDAEIQSRIEDRMFHLKIGGLIVAGIAALGVGQILLHLSG